MRYSEDIDLVRTTSGPVGPVLARVRDVLEPLLNPAEFVRSPVAPKPRFKTPAEDTVAPSKIRVNTKRVFSELVVLLPDDPWAKTEVMKERFGIL